MSIIPPVSRRIVISTLGMATISTCIPAFAAGKQSFAVKLTALEQQLSGRIGVCALDTGSGMTLAHRAQARFALCSTFKLLLAAAVLSGAERGEWSLAQTISFTPADILDHAPVVKAHRDEQQLAIETLTAAIIEVSDNTAANLLLKLIGGPASLTAYLRKHGDAITRLDRFETELNSNVKHDLRDTTTPHAMVTTMQKLLVGDVLSAESRSKLIGWMQNCRTGQERLRAGLPAGWPAGDKTGSGAHGAVNDVAIIWPPGRAPILAAVYMSDSTRPLAELDAAHAQIGKVIADSFG